jgi:glycosyltransferase involved in cell wall biosynthesis
VEILYAGHSLASPIGGGELSARALLRSLAATHHVETLCAGSAPCRYLLDHDIACEDVAIEPAPLGAPLHLAAALREARFRPALARRVRERPPDLLLLQQPAHLGADDVPAGTRVVLFVRSLACFGLGDPHPSRWKRAAGRVFRDMRLRRNRDLLRRADLIVTNSRFLRDAVRQQAAVSSEVVPPFIDTSVTSAPAPTGPAGALAFVGLDAWKGARLALQLADALPDRRFLFLEGARPSRALLARARRLANVTCEGWTDDMGQVFARARILLMPSLWDEPFGRLPVEAGAHGVPTIASARGGLPESVGGGGLLVDRADDAAAWIHAIRLLDDPARHASLSACARGHAASLDVRVTVGQFADLVRRHLHLDLGVAP